MSDLDAVNPANHPIAATTTLVLADPVNIKRGFNGLIDNLIEQTADAVIDWGTTRFASQRVVDLKDGTEMVQIALTVELLVIDDA